MYDLVIIGGGPAGTAAGVYAARKKLRTTLVTELFGGQSSVSPSIQNWIGVASISGHELGKCFETHLQEYAGDQFHIQKDTVTKVEDTGEQLVVTCRSGAILRTTALCYAAGSQRRKLEVPGAATYEHKGLTYCASCDGPLFTDKAVAVIGGGNAGFETALQLLAYTKHVTLLHRNSAYKADPVTVERALAHPNLSGILDAQITRVLGDTFVTGLTYKDKKGAEHTLSVAGIFVEIGLIPSTTLLEQLVTLDEYKRIRVDPYTQQTSHKRIWAAGDCTDVRYHQNNVAAGDAVKAIEHLYLSLKAA